MTASSPAEGLRQQIRLILDDISDYWQSERWIEPMKVGELTFEEKLMELVTAYAATVEREARQDELYGLKYTLAERKDDYLELLINARLAALQEPPDEAEGKA